MLHDNICYGFYRNHSNLGESSSQIHCKGYHQITLIFKAAKKKEKRKKERKWLTSVLQLLLTSQLL